MLARASMKPHGVLTFCAALFACIHHANSAPVFVKGGSATADDLGLCAGIEPTCTDYSSCTKLYVGPCMSASEGPSMMYTSSFVGLAFLNSTTNYNNDVNMQAINAWTAGTNGYREFDLNRFKSICFLTCYWMFENRCMMLAYCCTTTVYAVYALSAGLVHVRNVLNNLVLNFAHRRLQR
jgi:glycerol-3-phosphate acyltransferase PlsY